MRKLKILCLLATLWLMVGGCKKKDECPDDSPVTYVLASMRIEDGLGRNYIAAKQLPVGSIVVYDTNLSYATIEGNISWEQEKNADFSWFREVRVDFALRSEAIGTHSKTFYVKLDKDIDTLRIDYRIEDKCMCISNLKAFYNGNIAYTELGVRSVNKYDFSIIKR